MAATREPKLAKDQALAGLSFAFQPLSVAPPTRRSSPKAGRAPPAAAAAPAASAKVTFSLRERGPGPAYGSPPPAADQPEQDAGDSRPGSAAGLAALKLASLRRRAAVQAAAPTAAEPPPPQQAAAAQLGRQPEDEEGEVGALLQCVEARLAGCALAQLPPAPVLPPQHVLLGLPALAPGPPVAASAAASTSNHARQPEVLIAAYRPADGSCTVAQPEAAGPTASSHPDGDALTATGESAGSGTLTTAGPQSLEEALQCLGLLDTHPADGGQVDEVLPSASSSSSSSSSQGPAGQQQWVRLRAVRLVVAAKQRAAAAAELPPLVQRLRQVRMHLEFHKANLQRGRARSPRRDSGSPGAPPGPWLPGRSSVQSSKHRASRSSSPGRQLQPRPKVAWPTAETSELQVQLLGSLSEKLLLKLGLAVLRQAVTAARLRRRLQDHVDLLAAADLKRSALCGWHAAAVPTPQQEADAALLAKQLGERRQRAQLAAWRQWAAHRAWQRRQMGQGQCRLRHRLLLAATQHWRCYCQQRLVERLQGALAARWATAWGRRRLFIAWRQAAQRSAALKAALARGSSSSREGQARRPLPSQLEALAATAAAFQPVKEFVAEAAEQLACMREGLRSWLPAGGDPAEAQQADDGNLQQHEEPPPLGSVEALLAAARPQAKQLLLLPAIPALDAACSTAEAALPAADQQDTAVDGPPAACCASTAAAAPAPDPGSPPPGYNPASYASPARQQAEQHRWPRRVAAEAPAAVEAELLDCQEQVERLRQELEMLEQESAELQQECAQLESAAAAAKQAAGEHRHCSAAAAAAKQAAAEAMQAAVQLHTAAATECSQQERYLRQRQQESQEAVAAEAGARAAAHVAAERLSLAEMGVQRWSKAVEGIAKELAACHRTQQAPIMARLKEARQRLEQHKQEAAAVQQQLPELRAAAKRAGQQAQQAQQALLDAQQLLVAAAEHKARTKQQLDAAVAQHEAAAVAAVATEHEASSAEQRQRLLEAQQQAVAGQLRQAAQQVLHKQQAAALLQQQVAVLQARHRDALAAMLAAAERQQRRGKLKRRLQVVQEQGEGTALPSPSTVQQRRPPPAPAADALRVAAALDDTAAAPPGQMAAAAAEGQLDGQDAVAEAAAGALVLHAAPPPWAEWSCSSQLSTPRSEVLAPALPQPPLTVEEAAARFYTAGLLRRALHSLRHEAAETRQALQAADARWRRRQLSAVLATWRQYTEAAAQWLAETALLLRRRWLLRQWLANAKERQWQRWAEAAADAAYGRRLLATGVAAWQLHVQHERWRDGVHEAVMRLRMRNMLRWWRAWARQRRMKAARQRAALAVYERRLLGAALRQWRWVQRSKALLRRVFGTAVELWQEEVGARLHQRSFQLLQDCWAAWQLFVLQAQAHRRAAMLWNAAEAFRERHLLTAGLQAFQLAFAEAREQRRLAALVARGFAGWRRIAANSARHWEYEAARQHRQDRLLRLALHSWRAAAEATAGRLAGFWAVWQVEGPLRRALLCWRQAAAAARAERALDGMAEVHCERRRQRLGLAAFASNAAGGCAATTPINGVRQRQEQQQQQQQVQCGTAVPRASRHAAGAQQRRPARAEVRQQHAYLPPQPSSQAALRPAASPRQQQQQQPVRTTIVISHSRTARMDQQEQQGPALAGSSCSCASASQGTPDAMTDWRAAADFWRQQQQRHATFASARGQQQAGEPTVGQPAAAVRPQTLATLSELRAQWQRGRTNY